MSLQLIVDPPAEQDILDAYQWYEERSSGLGDQFLESIDSVFDLLIDNPVGFPLVFDHIRRTVTNTFPYLIFYLVEESSIHILAVIHAAQDPEYIGSRLDA